LVLFLHAIPTRSEDVRRDRVVQNLISGL
jgi:hypothetical protein